MKKRLIEKKNNTADMVLLIKMSPRVKYDKLVDALSVAKESGIKRISLKNVNGEG